MLLVALLAVLCARAPAAAAPLLGNGNQPVRPVWANRSAGPHSRSRWMSLEATGTDARAAAARATGSPVTLQRRQLAAAAAAAAASRDVNINPFGVTCSSSTFSKQSCIFSNVCLQPSSDKHTLHAYLRGSGLPDHAALLKRHLEHVFKDVSRVYKHVNVECQAEEPQSSSSSRSSSGGSVRAPTSASSTASSGVGTSSFQTERGVTMLWRFVDNNQGSYGHAKVNEAFPAFLVLQNHFGQDIPMQLQLLGTELQQHTLLHVMQGTITNNTQRWDDKLGSLAPGVTGLCFQQLLVGDGGYVRASRASLANSREPQAEQYAVGPSFFSSNNWWEFRRHAMLVNGVTDWQQLGPSRTRPLILLNDKRFGPNAEPDRRMILDIDALAANISARYPQAEVLAVRLRDLAWPDLLRLMARTSVFITTQGSSAFRMVFLPKGARVLIIGAPQKPNRYTEWTNYHELDRWFPLTYVQFMRYDVSYKAQHEYEVVFVPNMWQPNWWFPAERKRWWLYNSHVRVDIARLKPLLDSALSSP